MTKLLYEKEKAAFTLLTTVAVLIDCKVPESQARLWLKTAYGTVRSIRQKTKVKP